MPRGHEVPAPRRVRAWLAARATSSLPSLAHHINQRLLEQALEHGKMEQKIAEMKPSKRYAHTPHTLPLGRSSLT
jgi:hypothetical protein